MRDAILKYHGKMFYLPVIFYFWIFSNQIASAQSNWKSVGKIEEPIFDLYFFDAQTGFAAGASNTFRTTNGGSTWSVIPSLLDEHIRGFHFTSRLVGYAASQGLHYGVFETSDGGLTWTPIAAPNGPITSNSLYANYEYLISGGRGSGLYTFDLSTRVWTQIAAYDAAGVTFSTPQIGIVSTQSGGGYLLTRDGGKKWTVAPATFHVYSAGSVPSSEIFYALSEYGDGCYVSMDGGESWEDIPHEGPCSGVTGTVRASACDIYTQATDLGLFVSRTGAKSWTKLGGPSNKVDTKFFHTDGQLWAGDTLGNVWHFIDPGPSSTDPVFEITPGGTLNFGTASECDIRSRILRVSNLLTCHSITIKDVGWVKRNSSFSIEGTIGAVLSPQQSDSLTLSYVPSGPGDSSASLRIRYEYAGHERDTIITLTGSNGNFLKPSLSSYELHFDSVPSCGRAVRELTIINPSCDSLRLAFQPINPTFKIEGVSPPAVLSPLDSLTITVVVNNPAPGPFVEDLIFTGQYRGRSSTQWTVRMDGMGVTNGGVISLLWDSVTVSACDSVTLNGCFTNTSCDPVTLQTVSCDSLSLSEYTKSLLPIQLGPGEQFCFDGRYLAPSAGLHTLTFEITVRQDQQVLSRSFTVSQFAHSKALTSLSDTTASFADTRVCDTSLLRIPIENFGCETLQVTDLRLSDPRAISLISARTFTVAKGSMLQVQLQFSPTASASETTSLTIETNAGNRRITILANAIDSTPLPTLSAGDLSFGSLPLCDSTVRSTTLCNTSCRPLILSDLNVIGSFAGPVLSMPDTLVVGECLEIPIRSILDTTRRNARSEGRLLVSVEGQSALQIVKLSREYRYPVSTALSLESLASDPGKPTFRLKADPPIAIEMPLEFELTYDDDLLSNIAVTTGSVRSVSREQSGLSRAKILIPSAKSGDVAILSFDQRLAINTSTPIAIEQISFGTMGGNCLLQLDSLSSGSFGYDYSCGDGMLREILRNGELPFRILELKPNPTADVIQILLDKHHVYSVEILDMNGKQVLQGLQSMNANQLEIDVRSLPQGAYWVIVAKQGYRQSRMVIRH